MPWTMGLIFLGLLAAVGYATMILPTQWVKIERIHRPLGLGRTFVQISDLHVERLRVGPNRLRKLVAREQPDYILLTGDYTEKVDHVTKVAIYLRELRKVGVPIYAVFGNHDYRLQEQVASLFDAFAFYHIPVLRNTSLAFAADGFTLVGIDDWDNGLSDPEKAMYNVPKDHKVIIITHNPNVTMQMEQSYDYLMCGHFHGRQFRIPFLFWLKRKGPLARSGIYQGMHRDKRGVFYISKGIGQAELNARLLIRSELTVHEL